jgi:hypothetical protein
LSLSHNPNREHRAAALGREADEICPLGDLRDGDCDLAIATEDVVIGVEIADGAAGDVDDIEHNA